MKYDIEVKHFKTGKITFKKDGVTAPDSWSRQAVTTAASKYMQPDEFDVINLINRVLSPLQDHLSEDDLESLSYLLINQYAAPNSPVWFNYGVHKDPMGSACFILRMADSMEDIARVNSECHNIFKNGSGAGITFSSLRGSNESLSHSDGVASGPVPFIKIIDVIGGTIKSGGRTRRAAIMVVSRVQHPNIHSFVGMKWNEELKAHVLASAGYGTDMDSESYSTVAFQNLNSTVSVSDEFMHAALDDDTFDLLEVNTGKIAETISAVDEFDHMCDMAHKCGDPGIQYDDTINREHACPSAGRINGSNPCSEFMFIDESACNLSSLNLTKYNTPDSFDYTSFGRDARLLVRMMDAIVDISGYPTEAFRANSVKYRPLGLGYTGLATLLMSKGIPYDSDKARELAGKITEVMLLEALRESAALATEKGHNMSDQEQLEIIDWVQRKFPLYDWKEIAPDGFRNAQWTLLAPTGTISFIMDTGDSTGIEPTVTLFGTKLLAGGGSTVILSKGVEAALRLLNYNIEKGLEYLKINKTMRGYVQPSHNTIFDAAINYTHPTHVVSPIGHLKMMAAVQPYLSGAISKTINLPKTATVEDIKDIYIWGWQHGLKAIAVYREGTKMGAPISDGNDDHRVAPKRKKLPRTRKSITHHFEIMGMDGYLMLGFYGEPEEKQLAEVFVTMAKEGSTLHGMLEAWSRTLSILLQYGVDPLMIMDKYRGIKAEPDGATDDPDVPFCTSVMDFTAQYVEKFLTGKISEAKEAPISLKEKPISRICPDCGNFMIRKGRCFNCPNCGFGGGCS